MFTVPIHGLDMIQLKAALNNMVVNIVNTIREVNRVTVEVGMTGCVPHTIPCVHTAYRAWCGLAPQEARHAGRAISGTDGVWLDLTTGVNTMSAALSHQLLSIGAVATAVARGDLSKQSKGAAFEDILSV
jgi:hypothetical protein